jgi:hypothetical protein
MYKIIGADGKEYGPIAAEQLRQWIAENRVNAQTRILAESATEWKTVADCPEFAAAVVGKSPPPVVGISGPKPDADALAAEILARDYHVDIGRCVVRGWELVKANFWLTVGATFVVLLINFAVGSIPCFGSIATLALAYVLWGGLDWLFLKMVRGQKAEFSDAFAGFSLAFVPLMLFSLVAQLLTFVGLLLLILPGIYLMVAWLMFGPLLILDKRLDFWAAMELSRKVVHKHWWQVFGLMLVLLIVLLAGVLACGIGVFVAMPIATAASVYAYEDIFGGQPLRPIEPSTSTQPAI